MAVVKRYLEMDQLKQQVRFQNQQRQSKRQLVSGESHSPLGETAPVFFGVEQDDSQGVFIRRSMDESF